jgi:periplasmic protein TonB
MRHKFVLILLATALLSACTLHSTAPAGSTASKSLNSSLSIDKSMPLEVHNAIPTALPNYRNPRPAYPVIALSNCWEGDVKLHVQVSAEGFAQSININKSSGHKELDDGAIRR